MKWTEQQKRWAAMRRGERSFYWPHLNPNYTPRKKDMERAEAINMAKQSLDGWTPVDHLLDAAKVLAKYVRNRKELDDESYPVIEDALATVDEWSMD